MALLTDRALIFADPLSARLFFSPHIRWDIGLPANSSSWLVMEGLKDCEGKENLTKILRWVSIFLHSQIEKPALRFQITGCTVLDFKICAPDMGWTPYRNTASSK
jgi:hypothetical protein